MTAEGKHLAPRTGWRLAVGGLCTALIGLSVAFYAPRWVVAVWVLVWVASEAVTARLAYHQERLIGSLRKLQQADADYIAELKRAMDLLTPKGGFRAQ